MGVGRVLLELVDDVARALKTSEVGSRFGFGWVCLDRLRQKSSFMTGRGYADPSPSPKALNPTFPIWILHATCLLDRKTCEGYWCARVHVLIDYLSAVVGLYCK